MRTFRIATDLAAPAAEVWQRVIAIEGVNDELRPLMRMTVPRDLRGANLDDLPLGKTAGRSWILLFGLVLVVYDDLAIAERGRGRRFLEKSRMLTQADWWHERTVTDRPGGSRIEDRLTWKGRFPPMGALYQLVIPIVFRHRHRRLTRHFGVLPA